MRNAPNFYRTIHILALTYFLSFDLFSANLFWIGGTGNWNDPNHWSSQSGGASCSCTPTSADNVFFDLNSFTSSSKQVTVNATANCNSMDWTGSSFTPVLSGSSTLNLYGSLTFISAMTNSFTGSLYFQSGNSGNTIISAGKSFGAGVYFNGAGDWMLADGFSTTNTVYLNNGVVNTGNNNFTCAGFSSTGNIIRGLVLGSSSVSITGSSSWYVSGSNFSLDAGTSTLTFTSSADLYGGASITYNNIFFQSGSSTNYIYSGSAFNNVSFNGTGNISTSGAIYDSVSFALNGTISGSGNQFTRLTFNQTGTISSGNQNIGYANFLQGATISGSNSFDSLLFSSGKTYVLASGTIQTIGSYFKADGTCSQPVIIHSGTQGTASTISKSSGTITINYVELQDLIATGGAVFNANFSSNVANNTGWIFTTTASDLYWIGGSGNWNAPDRWSATSGGSAACVIPNSSTNVHFDANSFTSGSKTVTVNVTAYCNNMDWTGSPFTPVLNGTSTMNVYGSLTLISAMTNGFTGSLYFQSGNTGNTITSAGKSFGGGIYFNGAGDWQLNDALTTTGTFYLNSGVVNVGNNNLTSAGFSSTGNITRGLILGASSVTETGSSSWSVSGSNFSLDAGTSTIAFNSGGSLSGGANITYNNIIFQSPSSTNYIYSGATFNNVTFNGTGYINTSGASFDSVSFINNGNISASGNQFNRITFNQTGNITSGNQNIGYANFLQGGTFSGSNSFDSLFFSAGKTYTLTSGTTQTIGSYLKADGTCSQPLILHSGTPGTAATISKTSGTIIINYVELQDMIATGGAVFNANFTSNVSNNNGWYFTTSSADLYWIGGSGNWNAPDKWSATSGGSPACIIPNSSTNVHFDANSFTSGSKTVTINVTAYCNNMDWTGATFTPVLSGTSTLNLFGSLTLISAMTNGFTGSLYFQSGNTGNTITSAGKSLGGGIYFNGAGDWQLLDGFSASGTVYLNSGTVKTSNNNFSCSTFSSPGSNTRGMILGSSSVTLSGSSWNVTGSNFSLDAGTSTITFTTGTSFSGGAGLDYNNIVFQTTSSGSYIYTGASFNSVTFNAGGTIYGAAFKKLSFLKTGASNYLYGNNSIDTLIFSVGSTNRIEYNKTQTINNYLKADGTVSQPINIWSTTSQQATISKSSCIVCCNYINLSYVKASGGADWYAANSTNGGNNSGWNFSSCPASSMVFSTTKTNVSCKNGNNGFAKVVVDCGNGPFTYLWSTGATTDSIFNLSAATYTVTITDNNGGIKDTTFIISEPPALSCSASSSPSCVGQSTGSATTSSTGGTSPYSYLWNTVPPKTTSSVSGLASGGYTVTVTDANGCTAITTANVGSANPPTVTPSQTNVSCNAGSDGTATANAVGGNTPYSYQWSNGQNSATAIGLSAGTYFVTVSGSNSCASTDSIIVLESSTPLSANITSTNISCNSGSNGTALAAGTGGTSPYSYLWNNGLTTASITGLGTGTFNATVTDSTGCVLVTNQVTISEPAPLAINISSTDAKCGMDNGTAIAVATGGVGSYSFNWSNGDFSSQADSLPAGNYFLSVTDANGCTKAGSKNILQLGSPTVSIPSPINTSCFGSCNGSATAIVTGGASPYNFIWDDLLASSSATLSALCAGSYSVTVTDNNGCTNNTNANINQPADLTISISTVNSACNDHTGAATASASGGTSPYYYSWSGGQTTFSADSLAAGIYTVSVTEANGCSQFAAFTISDIGGPVITTVSVTNVSCYGGTDGAINIGISGTAPPYSNLWSNGVTAEDITGLSAGPYQVIVEDANGCTSAKDISISQPAILDVNMSVNLATCGSADGGITAAVSGGTTPYTYAWSTGATSQSAVALGAGIYYVTISDFKGCSSVAIAALGEVGGPTALVDSTQNSDCGSASGSIYVSISGGATPYSYNWSNGVSAQNLVGASAGSYTLTATDAGGCKSVVTSIISALVPDAIPICIVTVDSVTGKNLVVWEKPVTLAINSFNVYRESTQSGVYFLVGNVAYDSLSLFRDPVANPLIRSWRYKLTTVDTCGNISMPSPVHKTMHLTINLGLSNTINLIWDNYEGFPFSTYYIYRYKPQTGWNLIDSVPSNLTSYTDYNPPSFYGLQYLVEAVPSDVCSATKSENHNSSRSNRSSSAAPAPNDLLASATITNATQGNCNGGGVLAVSGGISPYTFLWNTVPPQTTINATGLCAGDYEVTVTDSEGDTAIVMVTIGTTIGINENSSIIKFRLFPNPAKGEIYFSLTLSMDQMVEVEIINTLGEENDFFIGKMAKGENMVRFDLENIANGMYFLRVKAGENKPQYLRFVKSK